MSVNLTTNKNIATITFDLKDSKVNLLNFDTLTQLDGLLEKVKADDFLKALIIKSAKKDVFIAGADIKEIENIREKDEGAQKAKAGQDIINKIEDLKIPTIAVVDGLALGGGCELILGCLYRVSTFNEKVRIGLPEVNLGIFPGFGGCYRMPRIVGLSQGLTMILTGKPVNSSKALKMGLVDKLFPQTGLDGFVDEYVQNIIEGKIKKGKYQRKPSRGVVGILEKYRWGHNIIFDKSRKNVLKQTKGKYPSPLKAIDVVQKAFYMKRDEGLKIESSYFGEMVVTEVSKNLIHVFYLMEKYKKLTVKGTEEIKPDNVSKTAVLGAGVMGGGIAQLLSSKGIWARLKDINLSAIAKGLYAANQVYSQGVKKRKITKAQANKGMAHITYTLDYSGFNNLDLVIEAVVENMDVKKKVFKELSDNTANKTILATNTSALSVTEMATVVKDPSKVVGFHFFNPVHRMPLVEVITTDQTSKETIVTVLALIKKLGKTPIVVKDSSGFVVNRILLAYISEAGRILEQMAKLEKMEYIDKLITDFGMPMGPFLLSDEVGLDVGIKVMKILEDSFGDRFKPAEIFEQFYASGQLGKKSGVGFYIHQKKRIPNPILGDLLNRKYNREITDDQIVERLILIMINEAAGCLADGIVDEPQAIDVGMIFGTGFPPFRGGLLKYADDLGIDAIVAKLEEYAASLNADYFKPHRYLLNLKANKKGFYSK